MTPEMLKLWRFSKVKVFSLVLIHVFDFDVFEFSAAILEKGLFNHYWESSTYLQRFHVLGQVFDLLPQRFLFSHGSELFLCLSLQHFLHLLGAVQHLVKLLLLFLFVCLVLCEGVLKLPFFLLQFTDLDAKSVLFFVVTVL